MKLSTTVTGTPTPGLPPVVLVHGLFGQGRNLGVIARALADSRQVVSLDLRNHGDSPWSDEHDYDALAGDVAEVIADHGGQADVVGHSMGGKTALWLALTRPAMLRRLVVLDIAPVAYGHSQADMIDAMEGVDFASCASRGQADQALAATVEDHSVRAFLLQSLDLKASPPRWRMNLGALRAQMDRLTGFPEPGERRFDGAALVLAGGDSDYVGPEGKAAFHQLFPQAEIRRIAGTGHWLHAERPAEVAGLIADFLG